MGNFDRLRKFRGARADTWRFVARLARRVVLWLLAVVLAVAVIAALYFFLPSGWRAGPAYNTFNNAVWLQHEWSEQSHTPNETRALVENLARHGVRYVYVHVGPLARDGTIPAARYAALAEFLSVARAYGDRMKFLAWIGQVRSKIPLQDSVVRNATVRTAAMFVHDFGMDGVHYDIEPISDDDADFLYLLEDTRKALDDGQTRERALISVALPELIPNRIFALVKYVMRLDSFLSEDDYRRVADRSDQVVVMTYENGFRKPFLYRLFVKYQVAWLTQLVGERTKILVGLPTYDTPTPSFDPHVENIRNGLLGVIDGLNYWQSVRRRFEGIAIYGYWTTDASEWKTVDELWGAPK